MARISKSPDIRRQELIDVGFALYMEKGMAGLNIKEIVGQVGVATGLFYYYFKSKEIFVDEALSDFVIKNVDAISEILSSKDLTVPQKLQSASNAFWTYAEQVAPYKNEGVFHTEQHHALTNKLLEQMQPIVEQIVLDGIDKGIFHTENPSLTAGYILYGLSSILNTSVPINSDTQKYMSKLVTTTLGINIDGGIEL